MSPLLPKNRALNRSPLYLTQAAIIAAAYIILTYPFASISFGPIQFRLSESLTVLAVLTPAAIPGLFLGCLLTNTFFNPSPLGPIDIVFGSLATLIAAFLTWHLAKRLIPDFNMSIHPSNPKMSQNKRVLRFVRTLIVLSPAVWVNAFVVGTYLPFIIPEIEATWTVILGFILSIALSEAFVVYVIGWPLLLGLRQTRMIRIP